MDVLHIFKSKIRRKVEVVAIRLSRSKSVGLVLSTSFGVQSSLLSSLHSSWLSSLYTAQRIGKKNLSTVLLYGRLSLISGLNIPVIIESVISCIGFMGFGRGNPSGGMDACIAFTSITKFAAAGETVKSLNTAALLVLMIDR